MVDDSTRAPARREQRPPADHDGPGMAFFSDDFDEVLAREQRDHGGTKVGAAFFGWLNAVGLTVLLLGLLGAVATASGQVAVTDPLPVEDLTTVGAALGVVVLLVLFVAYAAGGYVAGRMARFDGWRQGLAVWLWAVAVALVVGAVGLVAGDRFDVLARLDVLPRLPSSPADLSGADLTPAAVVTALLVLLVPLAGALLGGTAGTRYHRSVDQAGLGPRPDAG